MKATSKLIKDANCSCSGAQEQMAFFPTYNLHQSTRTNLVRLHFMNEILCLFTKSADPGFLYSRPRLAQYYCKIRSLSIWGELPTRRRESDAFNVFAKMDCILCQNAQKSSPNPPFFCWWCISKWVTSKGHFSSISFKRNQLVSLFWHQLVFCPIMIGKN